MNELIKKYKTYKEEIGNYSYALGIMSFDCQTDCPNFAKEYSMDVQSFFIGKILDIETSSDYKDIIKNLYENKESLDGQIKQEIIEEYKNLVKQEVFDGHTLKAHYDNINKLTLEWTEARSTLDYSNFEVELEKLIEYYKEYAKRVNKIENSEISKNLNGYDVLLDEMEDGFTTEKYDEFFDLIKKEIAPLVKKIIKLPKKYNTKLLEIKFDCEKQKKLTKRICELMGYTNDVGCIRETIHPFTNGFNANDVRITTSYSENELFSNIYSIMHEVGHALYELGQAPSLNKTILFGGTSCAMHESQSRFYENYLGRSMEFVYFLYDEIVKVFEEEMKEITKDDLYYYVNDVTNNFKRTEADELTYSIHILIRYEVEKMLFNGTIKVSQISEVFNSLFEEYFGVKPSNKLVGCYQDIHWTSDFGYFPTYALGNAFAAMFYKEIKKELNIDDLMSKGDFKPINKYLDEKIHVYGKTKKNLEILYEVCKEDFDPKYYIDYLKNKFKKIYDIN